MTFTITCKLLVGRFLTKLCVAKISGCCHEASYLIILKVLINSLRKKKNAAGDRVTVSQNTSFLWESNQVESL